MSRRVTEPDGAPAVILISSRDVRDYGPLVVLIFAVPLTEHIYVGVTNSSGNSATSGILDYTYNPLTGVITPVATNGGFLVTKTQALAGLSSDQIQGLSKQILQLAPQVGQAPVDLANSLYFLASAGVPANQMMATMKLSAEMAATGHFDAKVNDPHLARSSG